MFTPKYIGIGKSISCYITDLSVSDGMDLTLNDLLIHDVTVTIEQ